jgi:type IV pilus assembly protein PilA
LRQRIARDEGFTLIELLVVMIIIGILLAIAIPSYLGFRDRAHKSTAQSNLREAIPSAEAYFATHDVYTGMTEAVLKASYDTGMNTDPATGVVVGNATDTTYCLESTHGGFTYHYDGPGGTIPKEPNDGC